MLTVKMEAELERDLEVAARTAGLTKSEFVRREIAVAVERTKGQRAPHLGNSARNCSARFPVRRVAKAICRKCGRVI